MERSIVREDEPDEDNRYLRFAAALTAALLASGAGLYMFVDGMQEVGGYLIAAGTVALMLVLIAFSFFRYPLKPYR